MTGINFWNQDQHIIPMKHFTKQVLMQLRWTIYTPPNNGMSRSVCTWTNISRTIQGVSQEASAHKVGSKPVSSSLIVTLRGTDAIEWYLVSCSICSGANPLWYLIAVAPSHWIALFNQIVMGYLAFSRSAMGDVPLTAVAWLSMTGHAESEYWARSLTYTTTGNLIL